MASCMLLSMARCKVSSMMLFYETAYPTKNQRHVSARALSHTKASGAKKKFGSILRPSRSLTTAQPVSRARSPFSVRAKVSNNIDSKTKTIIPDPDYRIAITLLGVAAALVGTDNLLSAAPVGLLGLLLLVQTTRVRFSFDKEALEVKVGANLKESGENVFVGGKNRWKYSTFTNWELWWPNFPVLVYFKETQTKPEGQVHFFPVIFNGKQLYDVLVARAGPSKTSGPK